MSQATLEELLARERQSGIERRKWFNAFFASLGAGLAGWSLYLAVHPLPANVVEPKKVATVVVGFWGLVPPLFFWLDWVLFCRGMTPDERAVARHTHDLGRNIWVALAVTLGALFAIGVKLP